MGAFTMKIGHRLSGLGCLALTVALCGSCTSITQDRVKNPQNQETTSPSPSTSTPTLSQSCTNEKVGYTVQYPQKWFANSRQEFSEPEYVVAACRYFDKQPLEIEPGTNISAAIKLQVENIPFQKLRQMSREDNMGSKQLLSKTTSIGDRTTIITENQATGKGMLPEGLKFYSYKIDMGDRTFVATTYDSSSRDYQRNKKILDAMMDSWQMKQSIADK
jgi:hypothetical protein